MAIHNTEILIPNCYAPPPKKKTLGLLGEVTTSRSRSGKYQVSL